MARYNIAPGSVPVMTVMAWMMFVNDHAFEHQIRKEIQRRDAAGGFLSHKAGLYVIRNFRR